MAPRGGLPGSAHAPDLRAKTGVSGGPAPRAAPPRPGPDPRPEPALAYRAAAAGPPPCLHGAGAGRAAAALYWAAPRQGGRAERAGAERPPLPGPPRAPPGRGSGAGPDHRPTAPPRRAASLGPCVPGAPPGGRSGGGTGSVHPPARAAPPGASARSSPGRCRAGSAPQTPGFMQIVLRCGRICPDTRWVNAPSCFPVPGQPRSPRPPGRRCERSRCGRRIPSKGSMHREAGSSEGFPASRWLLLLRLKTLTHLNASPGPFLLPRPPHQRRIKWKVSPRAPRHAQCFPEESVCRAVWVLGGTNLLPLATLKTRLWPKGSQNVTPAPAHSAPSWKAEETHELQLEREGTGQSAGDGVSGARTILLSPRRG